MITLEPELPNVKYKEYVIEVLNCLPFVCWDGICYGKDPDIREGSRDNFVIYGWIDLINKTKDYVSIGFDFIYDDIWIRSYMTSSNEYSKYICQLLENLARSHGRFHVYKDIPNQLIENWVLGVKTIERKSKDV